MTVTIDTKEIASTIASKLHSLTKQVYDKLKTEKVLDVPTCSPLFKDSVKFVYLKKLEKETSKVSDLDKIKYEKRKILESYSLLQQEKMKSLVKYLESNQV